MKKWIIYTFASFAFSMAPLIGADNESAEEENKIEVPNPLELKKGWWEYFDVPAEQLPEKITAFRKKMEEVESTLDAEQHKEIIDLSSQVTSSLEFLLKKKNQISPGDPIKLQLLKSYSIPQIFEVYENLLQVETDIDSLNEKIESERVLLNRTQSILDKLILTYQELPLASFEGLLTGLKIMDTRIDLANFIVDIEILQNRLNYLNQQKRYLSDELINAQKKIHYENESLEILQSRWDESKSTADEAQKKLYRTERQYFRKEEEELKDEIVCCIWEYKILAQRIQAENLGTLALLNHLQLELYRIQDDETDTTLEQFESNISNWQKVLADSKENVRLWQTQLDEDHSRLNELIVKMYKEKGNDFSQDNNLNEVHFELTRSFASLQELRKNISKAELLSTMVENEFVQEKSISETWLTSLKLQWNRLINSLHGMKRVTLFRVRDEPITLGILFKSLLIVFGAILFSKYLRKFLIKREVVVKAFSKSTEYIVLRFINYGIILLGLLFALSYFGLDFRNLAIVAGALGVGIGFGLQSIVTNILSGFMLLLNRYLKVGDIIELKDNLLGRVISIDLQNTQVETFDGLNIVIPNSHLTSQQLINWTMYTPCRRFRVPFGVEYGSDKDQIKKAIIEAVTKLPFVVSVYDYYPSPQIWLKEYGDNSVNYELVAWVDLNRTFPHGTAHSSLMWEVDNVLKAHNINIPFPQRDIYVKEFPKVSSK